MIAKDKAKQLVNRFLQIYDGRVPQAKQCALICIDEILEALEHHTWQNKDWIRYYKEVKEEINKL